MACPQSDQKQPDGLLGTTSIHEGTGLLELFLDGVSQTAIQSPAFNHCFAASFSLGQMINGPVHYDR